MIKVADTQSRGNQNSGTDNRQQEQDIHQLLKVRREKLAALQEAGKDPFFVTKYDMTHHSMDIKNHFEELDVLCRSV